MRTTLLRALVAAAIFSACVGEDPAASPGESSSSGGGPTGPGQGGCKTTEKLCDARCVALDDPSYGCDPNSCGAPCPGGAAPSTIAACVGNKCAFTCTGGYADCDGNPSNGCEVRTDDDPANCGHCGTACGVEHTTSRACVKGKCAYSCVSGFAHCAADEAVGCDANVDNGPKSCGTCGHDCLGATCTGGTCDAVTLQTITNATALAIDASYVYVVNASNSKVVRFKKDGTCTGSACPEPVNAVSGDTGIDEVVTDGTKVFWALHTVNDGSNKTLPIEFAPVAGPDVMDLTNGPSKQTSAGFMAIAGGKVVWTNGSVGNGDGSFGRVYTADVAGTNVRRVADGTSTSLEGVTADASSIFWAANNGKIYKTELATTMSCTMDSNCQVLTDAAFEPYGIANDASYVYFSEGANNIEPAFGKTIKKVSKAGGAPTTLATNQSAAVVRTDGSFVYWGDAKRGALSRAKADATSACDGASCETFGTAQVVDIAIDDEAVYWIGAPGAVSKRAKK